MADLAGRSVGISDYVPTVFDAPLSSHHKLIGRWAAAREECSGLYTQHEARRQIERSFEDEVRSILGGITLTELRAVVLLGDEVRPPAIAIICDSVGQIDLGWIENGNVLRNTLNGPVAPVSWAAAAYDALCSTMGAVVPVFGFADLFEEVSSYYWDGETTDEGARVALIQWHGHGDDDVDEMMLPSAMEARRPGWMLSSNAAPLKELPAELRRRIRRLRDAHKAVRALQPEGSAWHFDWGLICDYCPDKEDCATLQPVTLVPADEFARELDDVGRHGMEYGFMDVSGLCALSDPDKVADWFASLRFGAELLHAAQSLIDLYPANQKGPA